MHCAFFLNITPPKLSIHAGKTQILIIFLHVFHVQISSRMYRAYQLHRKTTLKALAPALVDVFVVVVVVVCVLMWFVQCVACGCTQICTCEFIPFTLSQTHAESHYANCIPHIMCGLLLLLPLLLLYLQNG